MLFCKESRNSQEKGTKKNRKEGRSEDRKWNMINRNYIASPKTWHSVSIVAIIYIRTESGKSMSSIQVPNVMKQAIFLYPEVPNNCTAYFITYVEFYARNICPSICQHMGWESEYWFCASLLKMGQKWEYLLRFRRLFFYFSQLHR